MTNPDDGGPAFPHPRLDTADEDLKPIVLLGEPGMSLRDWFAGMALKELLTYIPAMTNAVVVASDAYKIADAMLAERAKEEGDARLTSIARLLRTADECLGRVGLRKSAHGTVLMEQPAKGFIKAVDSIEKALKLADARHYDSQILDNDDPVSSVQALTPEEQQMAIEAFRKMQGEKRDGD